MSFEVPEHVIPIRERVRDFIEERIYPVEQQLDERDDARVARRHAAADARGEGRRPLGARPPGGDRRAGHAVPRLRLRERGRRPLRACDGGARARTRCRTRSCSTCTRRPSGATATSSRSWRARSSRASAMTEPEVASSDPTQLQTRARPRRRRLGDQRAQVVHHRARRRAAYTTVMCRTEPDDVPDAPGLQHDRRADGYAGLQHRPRDAGDGHAAAATARSTYDNVRVPRGEPARGRADRAS